MANTVTRMMHWMLPCLQHQEDREGEQEDIELGDVYHPVEEEQVEGEAPRNEIFCKVGALAIPIFGCLLGSGAAGMGIILMLGTPDLVGDSPGRATMSCLGMLLSIGGCQFTRSQWKKIQTILRE